VTGKTAGALIQDRLTLEAQRLLTYTNASAAMVASELGFQDPAYFARFFKRRTGLSPIGFRNEQTRESG
ncbi:MAG: helix-turn-helix domain-containing protein, partial [Maritimibacter sp.]